MLWFACFLAVVNAVIIGLSFLFVKVAVSHASPVDTLSFRFTAMEITLVLMIVGALFFTVLSLTTHIANGTLMTMLEPCRNRQFVTAILYLGIFSSMVTTIFASLILKQLRAAQLIVFLNLSTIIAIIAGYFFMQEPIHSYHVIAAALIIPGVFGTNFFAKKEEKRLVPFRTTTE